ELLEFDPDNGVHGLYPGNRAQLRSFRSTRAHREAVPELAEMRTLRVSNPGVGCCRVESGLLALECRDIRALSCRRACQFYEPRSGRFVVEHRYDLWGLGEGQTGREHQTNSNRTQESAHGSPPRRTSGQLDGCGL